MTTMMEVRGAWMGDTLLQVPYESRCLDTVLPPCAAVSLADPYSRFSRDKH